MDGRVALVTGASSGIGRATAVELARRGARVMAVARREAQLRELAGETGVEFAAVDLATKSGCRRAVEETRSRLGPIEILVNAAGIGTAAEQAVWETPPAIWRYSMRLNLDAPYRLTRLAAADMVAGGWGRIVNVSSTAGQAAGAEMAAYCASKHGLIGLTRAAAVDLAPHRVTCNAVLPGWVRTEMADRSAAAEAQSRGVDTEQVWRERVASYSAGRIPTAQELAVTIAWLASDEASGVSGETVGVTLGEPW